MGIFNELKCYKRKEDSVLLHTRVKYWIFCNVLDVLLFFGYTNKGLSLYDISEHLQEHATFDYDCNVSMAQIQLWIAEMIKLNLIRKDMESSLFTLTGEGYRACQDQRFHSITATLYEAKYSRRLSRWSFIIALLAVLISLLK